MATDLAPHSPPRTYWQVPTFLLGAAAVAAVVMGRHAWRGDDLTQARRAVAEARAALDQPNPTLATVIQSGERALAANRRLTSPDPLIDAEAEFLVGSARLRNDSAEERRLALDHFHRVTRDHLPEADRPKLDYQFAKAAALLNEDPAKVIDRLKAAIDAGAADDTAEAYGLLAHTYLRLNPPDLQAAYDATTKQAQAQPVTDSRPAHPVRFRQADLLLKLGRGAEARPLLETITTDAQAELFFAARALLAQSYEEAQDWEKAARNWLTAGNDPQLKPAEKAAVAYRLGRCYAQAKRTRDATEAFQEAMKPGGRVARAAALRLAEQKVESAPTAALATFDASLRGLTGQDEWPAALVPLDEARSVIVRAYQQFRDRGETDAALKLSELFTPIAPPGDAFAMAGLVADDRALALTTQAKQAAGDQATGLRDQARAQYAVAAQAYETAAGKAPPGPPRASWLVNSADRYAKAGQPEAGAAALARLADAGPLDEYTAAAWYILGEALQEKRDAAKARDAFARAAASPGPYQARSRVQLALLDLAENKLDAAEKTLVETQASLRAAPQSDAATLGQVEYALADVAYERENRKTDDEPRDYATAEQRFAAALQQHPDGPVTAKARLCLGKINWYIAVRKSRTIAGDLSDDERKLNKKQMADALQRAIEQFEAAEQLLLTRQSAAPLSTEETAQLYLASWAAAESYVYLSRYDEAINRYTMLASRYPQQVEELAALSQIWHCCTYYTKQPDQARTVLSRIQGAFEKIPETAYTGTTKYHNRAFWTEWLDAAAKQTPIAGQ